MVRHISNIPLTTFRKFLESKGLKIIRTRGGYEIWSRKDLHRPVVMQSLISPVPEFIVNQILKTIGSNREELGRFMNS